MRRLTMFLALAAAVPAGMVAPAQAAAQEPADDSQKDLDRALDLIHAGKPQEGIAVLDTIIAAKDREYAGEKRVYCARSPAEAILYAGMGARDKGGAIVAPSSYCYSVYMKGYALVDLHRPDEARIWLERAVAMAPSNAQFIGELGEWHKTRKDWPAARAMFQRALDASALSPADHKVFDKTRAMRGIAFILVEEGKLDEAERLYRECLQLNPNDDHAKRELQYIAEQRGRRT